MNLLPSERGGEASGGDSHGVCLQEEGSADAQVKATLRHSLWLQSGSRLAWVGRDGQRACLERKNQNAARVISTQVVADVQNVQTLYDCIFSLVVTTVSADCVCVVCVFLCFVPNVRLPH